MSTRGCRFLDSRNVPYQLHRYEHEEKGAEFAARATGIPLEQMIKTLVIADPSGHHFWFALMPGDRELNLKLAAHAAGMKKIRMAAQAEAERITGYQVGGISPFGARRTLPVLLEESLTSHTSVGINGGARGCIVSLDSTDLIRVLTPRIAQLSGTSTPHDLEKV